MHSLARIVFMLAIPAAFAKASLFKPAKAELQGNDQCFQVLFIIGDLARQTSYDLIHGDFEKASVDAMSLFQNIRIAIRCMMKNDAIKDSAEIKEAKMTTVKDNHCYVQHLENAYQEMVRCLTLVFNGRPEELKTSVLNVTGMLKDALDKCH